MVSKLIRNIPDDDLRALDVRAAEAGKSTEAYIRDLIVRHVHSSVNEWKVTYTVRSFVTMKAFQRTQLVKADSVEAARQFVKDTDDELMAGKKILVEQA